MRRHHNLLSIPSALGGPLSRGSIMRAHGAYGAGFDYFIDATNGNDANDGLTEGTAWKTWSKITSSLLSANTTTRVLIKSGTYGEVNDSMIIDNGPTGCVLDITCESGVIMDGTAGSASANTLPIYVGDNGECTLNLRGNGLIIRDYNYTTGGASPNGIGWGGAGVTVNIYDTIIDGCVDGISGHQGGHGNFYDCTVRNSIKHVIANVSAATMNAYRCTFEGTGTETSAFVNDNGIAGLNRFYDCTFLPGANPSKNFQQNLCEFYRCQFGTLTQSMNVVIDPAKAITFLMEDCFVNGRFQAYAGVTFRRSFGFMSARVRNGTGDFTIENCVFSKPASGLSNILYSNFNDGGSARWVVKDSIFETTSASAFMSVDATNAGYLVSKSSQFFNNVLSGSAAFDADLIAADSGGSVIVDNVTGDANIGAANTLAMADYAFASPSIAEGAATDGGDCGFGAGEVVAVGVPA